MIASTELRLRVMTYNVLADAYGAGHPEYFPLTASGDLAAKNRYPRLADRIRAADADIICLQEVDAQLHRLILERLREFGYVDSCWAQRPGGKPDGVAMFVRGANSAAWSAFPLNDPPNATRPARRVAIIYDGRFGGDRVRIVNVHFEWDPADRPITQRYGMTAMQDLLGRLREQGDLPTIVCGDFNATPTEALPLALLSFGFVDCHAGVTCFTCTANGRPAKIDYIMTTPEWRVREAGAVETPGPETELPSPAEPSDHLPLTVDISLRPA